MTDVQLLDCAAALLAGTALNRWQRAFVVGCQRAVAAGRSLTTRQVDTLNRILEVS